VQQVPLRLRAWHQFRPLDNDDELNQLIRWAADRLGLGNVELPTVRWPEPIDFRPNFVDRWEQWQAIVELLTGQSRERILRFQGSTGLGKSVLVREASRYAKKLRVPVVHLDFEGGGPDVEGILGLFEMELGQFLPHFTREAASKTHLLRKDLRSLRQPVLVILDTYEGCTGNKSVVDWLDQQFFPEVETALGLAVIVSGSQVPDARSALWRDWARDFALKPITKIEDWVPWVEQHYPDFKRKGADLNTILMIAQGNPAVISSAVKTISNADKTPDYSATGQKPQPANLYICYSSKDAEWRANLEPSLIVLRNKNVLNYSYDRMVDAGKEWDVEVWRKLDEAEIVLCLVGRDFLATPYILREELPIALNRHHNGTARVIPLVVRSCNWADTPLYSLQTATGDTRPLNNRKDIDDAYVRIELTLENAWRELRGLPTRLNE
jgi:hypothetical protein